MDEERRTTVNLKECIRAARERVVFINTGFLDRTGDEIHTSMKLGAVLPKEEIKSQPWIKAYEDWNVDTGISAGLPGRAQIGKGMWTMPDEMRAMMEAKIAHPLAREQARPGCRLLPPPPSMRCTTTWWTWGSGREELASRTRARLSDILTPPAPWRAPPERGAGPGRAGKQRPRGAWVRREMGGDGDRMLEGPEHSGRGPDGGPGHPADLQSAHRQLAAAFRDHSGPGGGDVQTNGVVVDRQNSADPRYQPMAADFQGSPAFKAALDLVFTAEVSANGYTEEVLHARRREVKSREASP